MPSNKDNSAKAVLGQVHSSESHTVDLEDQQNAFEIGKKKSSAIWLMFQKDNA